MEARTENAVESRLKASTQPRQDARSAASRFDLSLRRDSVLKEDAFQATLALERRRAERSRKPFVLMLVDSHSIHLNGNTAAFTGRLAAIVSSATRETDIIGWYENLSTLAVIFTEINTPNDVSIQDVLCSKIVKALRDGLGHEDASKLKLSMHVFPENGDKEQPDPPIDATLYSDLINRPSKKRIPIVLKRAMDILCSGLLLLMLSPILAAIALFIKLTSKGPIIFEQERLGQFGRPFKCLKFRTMHVNNDPKIHREYVQNFIAGNAADAGGSKSGSAVYKIKDDPRVTPIGLLRKTSLDELPQFLNVFRGEMSLVGPRPPVRYEFEVYDLWHRRRVLEVKPGVTGLWQVSGRSRTSFDDMVRLDLRYSQTWSLWLDLRILFATPSAVFNGDGAF